MYCIRFFKDPKGHFNSVDFLHMLQTLNLCRTVYSYVELAIQQKAFVECYGFVDLELTDSQVDDYLVLEAQLRNFSLDPRLIIDHV